MIPQRFLQGGILFEALRQQVETDVLTQTGRVPRLDRQNQGFGIRRLVRSQAKDPAGDPVAFTGGARIVDQRAVSLLILSEPLKRERHQLIPGDRRHCQFRSLGQHQLGMGTIRPPGLKIDTFPARARDRFGNRGLDQPVIRCPSPRPLAPAPPQAA